MDDYDADARLDVSGQQTGRFRHVWPAVLILLGIGMAGVGLWRLYIWQFGTPDDLAALPLAAWELSPQRIDERIARQKKAIKKALDAGKDGQVQEDNLQDLQASRDESIAEWDKAVPRPLEGTADRGGLLAFRLHSTGCRMALFPNAMIRILCLLFLAAPRQLAGLNIRSGDQKSWRAAPGLA